jgi:hypothetical protein
MRDRESVHATLWSRKAVAYLTRRFASRHHRAWASCLLVVSHLLPLRLVRHRQALVSVCSRLPTQLFTDSIVYQASRQVFGAAESRRRLPARARQPARAGLQGAREGRAGQSRFVSLLANLSLLIPPAPHPPPDGGHTIRLQLLSGASGDAKSRTRPAKKEDSICTVIWECDRISFRSSP